MNYRILLMVVILSIGANCVAGNAEKEKQGGIASDEIRIHVHPYEDDPANFLRLPQRSPERDIRISLALNIKNIKAIDLIDVNAEQDRCDHYHTINLSYLYFEKPVSPDRVYTLISKPCIYQHSAKFKLTVTTQNNKKIVRTQSFEVHPYSDEY